MHRKDLAGHSFPLGIQAPMERPQWNPRVVSSTNGFHSILFFPCQRPSQTISATVAGGQATCKPSRCVWKLLRSKAAAPPPCPPRTPHTTIIFRVFSQRPAASAPRSQEEQSIPVGMFTVSWGCPSWGGLTIYCQHPFIKANQKKLTWLPVEPLMMGTWLNVPDLPNGCPQACPCSWAPCAHASSCHCLQADHPSHQSPLAHISACLPCCHVFLGALDWHSE